MSSSLPISHPEWNQLLQKRDAFQSQIAAVMTDLHSIDDSRPVVLGRYAAAFGDRLKALHSLEIEAARLKREIELVQAAFNSGLELDYGKIHESLDAEFADWQAKLDAEALDLAKHRGVLDDLLDPAAVREMRNLYRTLARRLHPDLNPDQSTTEAELWHRVNFAYDLRDLEELKALEILSRESDHSPTPDSIESLRALLEKLRFQLDRLLLKLAARRKEWPFDQLETLDDNSATAARQAELDERIHSANALRDERKQWLNQLLQH
jgi:hypothetical protein